MFAIALPDGVTAARVTLNHLVLVRIQVRQLRIFPAKASKEQEIDRSSWAVYTASRSSRMPAACSPGTLAARSGFAAEHPASTGRALGERLFLMTARCALVPSARGVGPSI